MTRLDKVKRQLKRVERKFGATKPECVVRRARLMKNYISLLHQMGRVS